jgi:hypothetical protein
MMVLLPALQGKRRMRGQQTRAVAADRRRLPQTHPVLPTMPIFSPPRTLRLKPLRTGGRSGR